MARGGIRQQSKGSWEITYELPRTADGKRKRESETVRGNKREAERVLAQRIHEVQSGTYLHRSEVTLGEYLERFLTEIAPMRALSPQTLHGYASKLRPHVIPYLGSVKLQQLTTDQVQSHYTELLADGHARWGKTLNRRTVNHVHVILRGALKAAVDLRLINYNPCDGAHPPKVEEVEEASLTRDQLLQLLTVTRGTNLEVPVHLAGGTGLRRGEIGALRWDDVDLEGAQLHVRRSVYQNKEGYFEKPPKTRTSVRPLPLPEFLHMVLLEHQEEQEKERERPGYQYQGLVVANERGGYVRPDTLSRRFTRLAKQLGLEEITLHSLRHTYASLMADISGNPKVVQELMGHAHAKVTMHYTHTQREQHRRAAEIFHRVVTEGEEGGSSSQHFGA